MSDHGPTRVLLASMKKAMRLWVREMRARRGGRRIVRRAAAAAAVTLAAGIVAGPAVAAVDPSGDNQQATNIPSGDTQVAMRGARPGPPPPMRPPLEVPRNSPAPPQRQQPIPPQRKPGELDPATRDQVERGQDTRDAFGRYNREKGWKSFQDKLGTQLDKEKQESDNWRTPEEAPFQPFDPKSPLSPPPLTQDEVDALNRQFEAMEPPGYVNQFREFAVNPLGRDLDKSNVDREIDRSYLNDPVNAPHNQDKLNDFRSRLHDSIDGIHDAQTQQDKDAARDSYNKAARDFNAAELSERDNYGGNEEGRQVPKHRGDLPPSENQEPPGPAEQGLPPTRNPNPADPDDTTDNDDSPQMDSPRSRAQHDPDYDSPAPDDTPQTDSPRSQAQDDPSYDSPAPDPAAPTDPDAPAPGVNPDAAPASDALGGEISSADDPSDTITGGYGEDSLGSYTGGDSLGTDSLGTDSNDAVAGSHGGDSLGADSLSGGYGTDSLGDTGLGSDSLGGDGPGGDSLGGESTGMGSDTTGYGGDSASGPGGDSTGGDTSGGMGSDTSGSMGGDSGGMGGDSSGGMGGDSSGGMGGGDSSGGGMGGMSSGGMGGDGGF